MLTDKQVRDGFRFEIFQSRIYRPDAVESGMGQHIASEQESPWLFSKCEEVNAVAHIVKENMHLLALAPAKVGSYD